jgi:hypothetical protein
MWLRGRVTGRAVTVVLEPLQETRVAVVAFAALLPFVACGLVPPLVPCVLFVAVPPLVPLAPFVPVPLFPPSAGCVAVTVAEAGSGRAVPSTFVPVPF